MNNNKLMHEYYTSSLDELINFIWAQKTSDKAGINICLRFNPSDHPRSLIDELVKTASEAGILIQPYSK